MIINNYLPNPTRNWELNRVASTHKGGAVPNVSLEPGKNGKASVLILSDVHIGQLAFNESLFLKHLELAKKLDSYIILGGDIAETAINGHIEAALWDQTETPGDQIWSILKYFEDYKHRIIFSTSGNHEIRTWKKCGVDISELMAAQLGCFYNRHGGYVKIRVADQEYTFAVFHGYSGGQANPWLEPERRWSVYHDADLIAIGHVHHLAHRQLPRKVIDKEGNEVRKMVHFVRTGSFMTEPEYSRAAMYSPTLDGAPFIFLDSKEHKISVDAEGETRF